MALGIASTTDAGPVSVAEGRIVVAIFVVAAVLRCWNLPAVAIEHFDEGVYASNLWFGPEENFRYPAQHLYAPPLWPAVLEVWAMVGTMLGIDLSGAWMVVPGVVVSLATVVLVWWLARSWISPVAGCAAAALLAGSALHIDYARTALTDSALLLGFLAGLWRLERALALPTAGNLLLAAAVVSVTWATKYNGWLPLAIAGAVLLAETGMQQVFRQPGPPRRWMSWLWITVMACVGWSWVPWGLQSQGGYAAVAANHQQYITGWSRWPEMAWVQLSHGLAWQQCLFLAAVLVCSGIVLGWSARNECPVTPQTDEEGRLHFWQTAKASAVAIGSLGVLAVVLLSEGPTYWPLIVLAALAAMGVVGRLRAAELCAVPWTGFLWLLAATIAMLLLTPLYTPYPRLSLPVISLVAMLAGGGVHTLERRFSRFEHYSCGRFRVQLAVAMLAAGVLSLVLGLIRGEIASRDGLAQAVRNLVREQWPRAATADPVIVYVAAEPAALFHLRAAGLPLVAPIQSLAFADVPARAPTFLVWGPHAEATPALQQELATRAGRLERIGRQTYSVSPVVARDAAQDLPNGSREQTLTLYRLVGKP